MTHHLTHPIHTLLAGMPLASPVQGAAGSTWQGRPASKAGEMPALGPKNLGVGAEPLS